MPEDSQDSTGSASFGSQDIRARAEPDLAELISAWYRVARARAARRGQTAFVPFPRPAPDLPRWE